MSRRARERTILELIHEQDIHSQAELVKALEFRGLDVTQATVSRDMKRLGLVKLPLSGGKARYAAPEEAVLPPPDSVEATLRSACEQFVTEVGNCEALLLVKTLNGRANAVAIAIDEARIPEVAGTIAGDDTLLIVLRRGEDRLTLLATLQDMLR